MNRSIIICILALAVHAFPAGAVELEKPLYTQVYLRANATEPVVGDLIAYDDTELTIRTSREERVLRWRDLTGDSACTLRSRLIDRNNAADWLKFGAFAWEMGVEKVARQALATAVRMDPSLKDAAATVTAEPSGSAVRPTKTDEPAEQRPAKYEKSTPEQDAVAIETFRKLGQDVARRLEIELVELQTDHFIIFTNWDKREHNFLKRNVEAAYAAVSKQFDIPVSENIFIGKLPVFMFDEFRPYRLFAENYSGIEVSQQVKGYFAAHRDGTGHMAMWKPDVRDVPSRNIDDAKRFWAYVLTHEFTHAFIARYRNNRNLPTWLHEGIAEVIASGVFPDPRARQNARAFASRNRNIAPIFSENGFKGAEYYPVMRTVTELLVARSRKKFLDMIDEIKAGTPAEEALKKHYNWTYPQLEAAWRAYMLND